MLTAYHRFKLHDSHQFEKTKGVYSQKMIWTIIWKEYKWTLLGTAGT